MNVAICIITCQRPEGLKRLLTGLSELTFQKCQPEKIEVIVVDNDAEGSASSVCESLSSLRWPIHYYIEPRRGIPVARNRAIKCTREGTDFIAFIDDDEVPTPEWLDELLDTQRTYEADVVSGPVLPYFKEQAPKWILKGQFFERERYSTGFALKFTATNNVLIHTRIFKEESIKRIFDERFALTGGEDTHFFMRVYNAGYKIVWSDEALVYEWIPKSRTNVKWLLQRAYRGGNTYSLCEIEFGHGLTVKLLRTVKATGRISQGILLILMSPLFGQHVLVRALQHIYRSVGMFAGMAGMAYEEYKIIHR